MENQNRISIIDDEGKIRECEILFTYECPENGKKYVVFYPVEIMDDEDESDLFAYSYIEDESGHGELFAIESDEEFDMINDVIDEFYQTNQENEEE